MEKTGSGVKRGFFLLIAVFVLTACLGEAATPSPVRNVVTAIVQKPAPSPTPMVCTNEPNGPTLKLVSGSGRIEGSGFVPGEELVVQLRCKTAKFGSPPHQRAPSLYDTCRADRKGKFEFNEIHYMLEDWQRTQYVPTGTKMECHLKVGHRKGVACLDIELQVP